MAPIRPPKTAWEPLLTRLRGRNKLWHRANVAAFRSILSAGAILPNRGNFETRYRSRFNGKFASVGHWLGAVHLFDFDTASIDDVLSKADIWGPLLTDGASGGVVFEINPTWLDPNSLKGEKDLPEGKVPTLHDDDGCRYTLRRIQYVETWYVKSIPLKAIDNTFAIRNDYGSTWIPLETSPRGVDQADLHIRTWFESDSVCGKLSLINRLNAGKLRR